MTDPQLDLDALAGMTPEQINEAHDAGRFDVALGRLTPEQERALDKARRGLINRADAAELARMGRHDLIVEAGTQGRITTTTKEN